MNGEKEITLGSGHLYCILFTGTKPDDAVIETEENRLGYIQGGCALNYKPDWYECSDDLGYVKKKFLTKEESTMKTGIMTWNGNTLKKLCSTARVTEDTTKGIRNVKIGGIGNYKDEKFLIRFKHVSGNKWVDIVGSNVGGFDFNFLKDKETVIDAEFRAQPQDDKGTLIDFYEKMPTSP